MTYVFGRNDSYWYRQTEAFGRYNLVGSTVKEKDKMPKDLLADEKHAKAHGGKWYAWTLLHNYRIYCPRAKISNSFCSPAHKLNGFIYRNNWLENLLVASSCQGFRLSHKKRLN
ncbi:MAG: hypothetical protein GY805_32925 [Chloroflexi bacterium]|nr:hypothetical protein [Chloroflexota bacterium]